MPATAVDTRYQRLRTIASGGMATVHLGRALDASGARRPVAIKVLHPHLAHDPEIVAMFLDEARVATRIHHPNVVEVNDVDMVGDEIVIVMQFVEGTSLHALLRAARERGEPIAVELVARMTCDALAGLHAAHELTNDKHAPLGVVHRDVSPQNLLVGADGTTRVTDFGVATAAGRVALTRPDGTIKGKLQYLAPEQVQRRPVDRRTDVFAAGIVLWECLTGRALFGGGTEAETLAMVLREPIAPPSAYRNDLPPALDDVCLRALERDPERRFSTALEMAHAIEKAAGTCADRGAVGAFVLEMAAQEIAEQRDALANAREPVRGEATRHTEGAPPPRAAALRPNVRLAVVAGLSLLAGALMVWCAGPPRSDPARAEAAPVASAVATPEERPPDPAPAATPSEPAAPAAPAADAGPPRRRKPPKATGSGRPFMPSNL